MKLSTLSVRPGDWIVIEGGAPNQADLSPQYVYLNSKAYPAFVDQDNLILRCPQLGDRATADVAFNGVTLGTVQILR